MHTSSCCEIGDALSGIVEKDAESTPPVTAPPPKRDKHLYQLDLVRLITFAAVILDHVMLGVIPLTSITAGGIEIFLRYSRYSFFALTGFVLGFQYRNRELDTLTFWRRRYKLIGIPYVTWTLFYWVYSRYDIGGWHDVWNTVDSPSHILVTLKSLAYDLITGNAWYHLYFLFVSMQIYLVFPALLWVLKRTWGYHRYLLVASGAFHVVLLYAMVRPPLGIFTHGPQGTIWMHLLVTILPYQFFVLSGCIAALHFEAFHAFLKRYRLASFAVGIVVMSVTLIYYVHRIHAGEDMFRATNVFMLHNAFAYIAIVVMLYGLGSIWQERRNPGSTADRFLKTAADRSFGIYLAHGLALEELMNIVHVHPDWLAWPTMILTYLGTAVLTVFMVEVLRRSPISLMTTGREPLPAKGQRAWLCAAVGGVGVVIGITIRLLFHARVGDLTALTGAVLIATSGWVWLRQRRALAEPKPVVERVATAD
ncbi:acyltransferase [Gordonia sp. TBRC 11910]|uniref:Acyltransferase n=1 Tax=Gordonia asplenii TaxID=2725283 RepID=A0A848L7T7_9ACTN|nr:acyltransferase [Gordonia asplenii]NMO03638.1 acyltransferase [Gordonia asplenii]